MRRVCFHFTPKHASWLNMAEIEIGILSRQCLARQLPSEHLLCAEITAWQARRNALKATIHWSFSLKQARHVFARFYPDSLPC